MILRLNNLLRLLPLLVLVFAHPFGAGAQSPSADNTYLDIPKGEYTMSEGFAQVERHTHFRFSFSEASQSGARRVSIPQGRYSVAEVVSRLMAGSGYTAVLHHSYYVVTPANRASFAPGGASLAAAMAGEAVRPEGPLKKFVAGEQREPDSTYVRLVESDRPFRFDAAGDHTFATPGTIDITRSVPEIFAGAERWQRSKFAVKTNLLYGAAALAPNLRGEWGLGNRTTLEAGVSYNGWNLKGSTENNKKLVHGMALTEFRYWFCERFFGHFLGVHTFGGFYNVSGHDIPTLFEREFRYEGYTVGAGVSWGYLLPLSARWNLEFNLGAGVAYLNYTKWGCNKCDAKEGDFQKIYLGPTRAGISLEFIIK
jgi:hypothetical protein